MQNWSHYHWWIGFKQSLRSMGKGSQSKTLGLVDTLQSNPQVKLNDCRAHATLSICHALSLWQWLLFCLRSVAPHFIVFHYSYAIFVASNTASWQFQRTVSTPTAWWKCTSFVFLFSTGQLALSHFLREAGENKPDRTLNYFPFFFFFLRITAKPLLVGYQ